MPHFSPLIPHPSARRGSALLIVIGMLSFMVISAVSFAIFMRQGRLPSSYLRRNASSRYLLKAALANAIARIDGQRSTENGYCEGILDDVYPGVGPTKNYTCEEEDLDAEDAEDNSVSAEKATDGDYWVKRVFCPFGLVSPEDTVPTLTLEALAYLPPAIINEVRVCSRRTRTAKWSALTYDAGRYAFCAVDVSDCFDINKLCAADRRFAASPDRLNLASLFPTKGDDLETILNKCSNHEGSGGGKIPFVSVADFNIVAGGQSAFSPFARGLGTKDGINPYIDQNHETVSNALFITDTWFPPTNTTTTVKRFDLEADDGQPFRSFDASPNFLTVAKNATALNRILQKNIGGVGLACLYDYLDKDSRPISFVIPTVETVPMVVGIGLAHNSRFAPAVAPGAEITSKEVARENDPNNTTYKYKSQKFSLAKLMDQMVISGVVAFPFKRATAKQGFSGSFTGEALVRVFFGPKTIKSRLDAGSPLYPKNTSDWETGYKRGVVTVKCPIGGLSFASNVKKTTDAVKQFTAQVSPPSDVNNAPLFHFVKEVKVVKDKDGNTTETETGNNYYSLDGVKDKDQAFVPRDADGNEVTWWTGAAAGPADPTEGGDQPQKATASGTLSGDEYVPHVLVWVRIKQGNNTVDIVPARIDDDGTWGASAFNAMGMVEKFGAGTPVLEFRGDEQRAFKYTADDSDAKAVTKMLAGTPETFPEWTQLYAVDPRYNHAPENWFAVKGNGDAKPDEWLKAIGADGTTASGIIGTDGRDRDIFLFTSDQEVLQSVGELAFLPYVQEMNGSGDFFENDYLNNCNFSGKDFLERGVVLGSGAALPRSDMSKFASGDFMWRTYTAFDQGDGCDPIYALRDGSTPVEVVAGQGAFRVNPFSPDSRVLMAALKDTPFDYTVASDNDAQNKTIDLEPSQRAQYAFCRENSVARLDDDELLDIADAMHAKFQSWAKRTSPDRFDWEAAFRNMMWTDADKRCNDEQKSLFGLDDFGEVLHGVDRKYLFSFWRECFQNRQQLFLIFLRAEPLTVGGMGEGSLASSQLGARGVALVWRDPQPPADDNNRRNVTREERQNMGKDFFDLHKPHRTRVLFYHQFD